MTLSSRMQANTVYPKLIELKLPKSIKKPNRFSKDDKHILLNVWQSPWSNCCGKTSHRIIYYGCTGHIVRISSRRTQTAEARVQKLNEIREAKVVGTAVMVMPASVLLVLWRYSWLRFCVDYRLLNAFDKRDSCPVSQTGEYTDCVGKAARLLLPDARSTYA